jgi:hypothetical protein
MVICGPLSSVVERLARAGIARSLTEIQRSRTSGKKGQSGGVTRAHDGEVASIESRYVGHRQALCGGDHRAIDRSQRQIAIELDKFGDTEPVLGNDGFRDQVAGCQVPQESDRSLGPESSAQEVDNLGHYQDRYQQRTRMGLEQFEALGVVVVVCIHVGVERAGVNEEGYRLTSSRRISSIRTETS